MKLDGDGRHENEGLRWLGLAFLSFVAEFAVIYGLGSVHGGRAFLPEALLLAHIPLLWFLVRNLSFWGIRLLLLGLLLNLGVMLANGGLMPVDPGTVEAVGRQDPSTLELGAAIPRTKNVFLERGDIELRPLADVVVLPLPRPVRRAVSPGDIVLAAGAAVTLVEAVRRRSSLRLVWGRDSPEYG